MMPFFFKATCSWPMKLLWVSSPLKLRKTSFDHKASEVILPTSSPENAWLNLYHNSLTMSWIIFGSGLQSREHNMRWVYTNIKFRSYLVHKTPTFARFGRGHGRHYIGLTTTTTTNNNNNNNNNNNKKGKEKKKVET